MNKQSGFSIVELMIALVIGLIVSVAVFTVFVSSLQTNKSQDNLARLQENVRYVLSQMQSDIRMTGFRGCLGRKGSTGSEETIPVNNIIKSIDYSNDFDTPLQGFNSTPTGWQPSLHASISSESPTPDSDIITVRFAGGAGTPVTQTMLNGTVDIPIAGNPDGFVQGSPVLVSDCVVSTAFNASTVSTTAISHLTDFNTTQDLGRAFGPDAIVMPISTITYYVAPSADKNNGSSLWRKTNNIAAEELAENIEKIKILYGEDIDGDLSADKYVTANNVNDMKNVLAIRLMILASTTDDKLSSTGQKYTFNGVADNIPTDKRIRRSFSQIIAIRNRAM